MIGLGRVVDTTLYITLLFADDPCTEKELINATFEYLKNFSYLITFNGDTFDIPFVKKRCQLLDISSPLSNLKSFDIFKKIKGLKSTLNLPNAKQKSFERFLKIEREDKYTGGELIDIYKQYVVKKEPANEELLILHNKEDIIGLSQILPILAYEALFINPKESIANINAKFVDSSILITGDLNYTFKEKIIKNTKDYSLLVEGNKINVLSRSQNREHKMYFANYKDYYYLPLEDRAIHKSLATFVDKNCREKATIDNCYDKIIFDEDMIANECLMQQFLCSILSYMAM